MNHVLVLGERHLRRILIRYFAYYHRTRTHLSLAKDALDARPAQLPAAGPIVEIPEVGGPHHRYVRFAALSSAVYIPTARESGPLRMYDLRGFSQVLPSDPDEVLANDRRQRAAVAGSAVEAGVE